MNNKCIKINAHFTHIIFNPFITDVDELNWRLIIDSFLQFTKVLILIDSFCIKVY